MEKIINLVKELNQLTDFHLEYQDNDNMYIIDSRKDGDTITIKVTMKENKDKKEFENWVNQIDGDTFQEIWEALADEHGLSTLNELYQTNDYKKVIQLFKSKARKVVEQKIANLQKLL